VPPQTDLQLLERHQLGDADAFRELVARHIDWVYSAAKRRAGGEDLAEDVAQAVFIALAKRPPRTTPRGMISPWLFGVLIRTCKAALHARATRRRHETEAAKMRPQTIASPAHAEWSDIAPHLEESVRQLRTADREIVLLRFYEQKSFAEIAERIGISEDAARKRVSRSVEALRGMLSRKGLTAPAALAAMVGAQAVQPAPSTVSAAVVAAAAGAAEPGAATLMALIPGGFVAGSATAFVFALIVAAFTFSGLAQPNARRPAPPTPPSQPATAPGASQKVQRVIAQLRATEQRLRTIEYDATLEIEESGDAARNGHPLHPLRQRQTQHVLQDGPSRATWQTRELSYPDPSLNKIISARTLTTPSTLAYWDVGERSATQTDLPAPASSFEMAAMNLRLRAGDDPLRYSYTANLDTETMLTFPGNLVAVSQSPPGAKPRLLKVVVAATARENAFCEFEMDMDRGSLITHSKQYASPGALIDQCDLEPTEVEPGVWLPKRIELIYTPYSRKTTIQLSNIKLHPDLDPSRFAVQSVLQLPDETSLYRTLADGTDQTYIMKAGVPVSRDALRSVNRAVNAAKATTRSLLMPASEK
jgi:RNA polymerase sigma factor (sigma-70 family)